MKIFVTREIPEIGLKLLRKKYDVKIHSSPLPISSSQLVKNAKDCSALVSLLTDKIDKNIIDSMPNCKIIANYAVGYNNIDVVRAKSKGIVVTNTPDVLTDSTADLAIALTLSCGRRFYEGEKLVRQNKFKGWHPNLLLGMELKDKYFGILGAGRIGTATAIRAHSFGCRILYYSNRVNPELERKTNAKKVSLNSIIKTSDILSLHLPLTKKTNNLLNSEKLEMLKSTAILINTARGEIVDEIKLIKMLKSNRIFSAGFDVYQNEPKINSQLLKLDNVILQPHLGSATIEARNKMSKMVADNVIAVLSGKKPITPV